MNEVRESRNNPNNNLQSRHLCTMIDYELALAPLMFCYIKGVYKVFLKALFFKIFKIFYIYIFERNGLHVTDYLNKETL